MKLGELLGDDARIDSQAQAINVGGLAVDSRVVKPGDLFFALAGHKTDGARFIEAAIAAGAVAVLSAAMGVAMLIDWLATLYDSRWRVVLTLAALTAAGLTTVGWLLLAWRRHLRWERVAGDVDHQIPQLEERWTTMTRLAPDDTANPQLVHPAMFRHVATEAVRWEPQVDPERVVSLSILMKTMLGLTAITAVLAVAVFLDSRQTLVLMRRFWLPTASISATQLVNVPGDIVVGQGEPLAAWTRERSELLPLGEADDGALVLVERDGSWTALVVLEADGTERRTLQLPPLWFPTSGRIFGAYLPPELVKKTLEEERSRGAAHEPGMPPAPAIAPWAQFEASVAEVRRHGLSRSEGEIIPGINAMSAPVFDHTGAIVLGLTVIGPAGVIDTQWDGPLARALSRCAAEVSQRLGGGLGGGGGGA